MKIEIKLQANKVPIFYRNRFYAMIKQAVTLSNKDFSDNFFQDNIPKPFTFSVNFGKFNLMDEWITLNENVNVKDKVFLPKGLVSVYISSSDHEFLFYLIEGLKQMKYFEFTNIRSFKVNNETLIYKIVDIKPINQKPIKSNEVIMRTHSPILLENHLKKPILLNDENVNEHINHNINKMFEFLNFQPNEPLEIKAIEIEKQVVKHTHSGFLKSSLPYFTYTCSSGLFLIKGDPKDLDIIRNIGLGNRTAQGFGMVDIVRA